MRLLILWTGLTISLSSMAQDVSSTLSKAVAALESQPWMEHASMSLYIVQTNTGKVVFDKNAQLGLAPASTLKVVTSASAFELLGKDFVYQTKFLLNGKTEAGVFTGDLKIAPSGDPSLGSWRWQETDKAAIAQKIAAALKAKKLSTINGTISLEPYSWDRLRTPGGWIWEDVGNYFGAGAGLLNWNENSYKLVLKPGKAIGDPVTIIETVPEIGNITWINELQTAKAGSGDNAVIYLPERGGVGYLKGTIPAGVERFTIRGSMPAVEPVMIKDLKAALKKLDVNLNAAYESTTDPNLDTSRKPYQSLVDISSPGIDSINYWFMKESINLYGEALLKTIAFKRKGKGETNIGIEELKDFWKLKGISAGALNIKDGSGLSPSNRITAQALVTILQYASDRPWFNSFYHALPLQNNIKMKSGYIGGVRSYAGFIKSKSGEAYSFAFIINNFEGSPTRVREKMWEILDILK